MLGHFVGQKKSQRKKTVRWEFFGVLVRGYIEPFWAVLGLCWAHVGSFGGLFGVPWKFLEGTTISQTKTFRLGFILGALEGLCRANVGPFWVYVGPTLGHLVGFMGLHGGL